MMATSAQGSPAASKAVHYKSQPIARRKNQSAVYYAAYVTGTVLHDARRDKTFWRKDSQGDVLHWEIVGPQGAEGWTIAELWNGAEAAAKKVNERPGRQTVIALPHELCQGDREAAQRVARGHCLWLRDQYGIASTWALHAPNPQAYGESALNWHIHIVETDRRISTSSAGRPVFGAKVRELTDGKQGKIELERRRADWEKRVNAELHRAGAKTRVTLGRSDRGDGPDYLPGVHRGPEVNAMLRKHQADARSAVAAGKPVPQAPPRLAAFFAFAEARQAANTASRSFWEATGQAASAIAATAAQMTTEMGTAAAQAAGATLLTSPILDALTATAASARSTGATVSASLPDTDPVDQGHVDADHAEREAEQARAREDRAWERFWQEEARKAVTGRQRQR
jgi:hypothetical protein